MREKHIAGIGGGLFLVSLLIIVIAPVFEEVKDNVFVEGKTPGFTQLEELKNEAKDQLHNNPTLDEFQDLLGNVTDDMKENLKTNIDKTFSDI